MAILTKNRESVGDPGLTKHVIGNALVVHPMDSMTRAAQELALAVAADTENDIVVVDLPAGSPATMWESVAGVLPRRKRGVRLVIGGRPRETTALAGQWLAERLKRTVLVPDGPVVRGAGGSLFVHSGPRSGWIRCHPGRPPRWEAKRFPRPTWDAGVVSENFPTSARGMAEPLPSGLWIRPIGDDPQLRQHRRRLIEMVPTQPELVTVALGSPGGIPLSQDDVALMWRHLPEQVRALVRFMQYGPMSVPRGATLGQLIADTLGREIVCYTGMPIGPAAAPEIFTVRQDGSLGWHTYARQLAYRPREASEPAPVPAVVNHRAPIPGGQELSPGVYWLSVDAVVEVVQSGLLVRPPAATENVEAIRAVPIDSTTHNLMFDAATAADLGRMEYLAGGFTPYLGNSVRPMSRVVSARDMIRAHARSPVSHPAGGTAHTGLHTGPDGGPVPALPEATEVLRAVEGPAVQPTTTAGPLRLESAQVPAELVVQQPVSVEVAAAVPAPPSPDSEPAPVVVEVPPIGDLPEPEAAAPRSAPSPAPAPAVARLQPVPEPEASALLPKRGIEDERAWLRRTLSAEFGTMSNSVARVLSEHPGFQGALSRSSAEVLTDAVAVQLYLSARGQAVDEALRTATVGPHVPFARCVVAGLSRLPSHRGPAVFGATPTPREWQLYRDHRLLTEWGFVHALTDPCAERQGSVDVVVWSMTARRTRLLESADEGVAERVLFVPGTSFKVLELTEPQPGGSRGRILLRELTAAEIDADGRVDPNRISLDELALSSLHRQLETWSVEESTIHLSPASSGRFGTLPGLVSRIGES